MIRGGCAVFLIGFCFVICVSPLLSVEAGIFAAKSSTADGVEAGLWGGIGLLIPMFKLEVELFPVLGTENKGISAGVKFRPKFGSIAPYAIVGAGTFMDRLVLDFSAYEWYTFIGGGLNYFIRGFLSFRVDLRIFSFSSETVTRLAAGLMVHI